jgi:phytoene/squalene synthetase
MSDGLRRLVAAEAGRAVAFLERGLSLLPQLPRSSRPCLWLLAEIYRRISVHLSARGYDVFSGRIALPTSEKLLLVGASLRRRR